MVGATYPAWHAIQGLLLRAHSHISNGINYSCALRHTCGHIRVYVAYPVTCDTVY